MKINTSSYYPDVIDPLLFFQDVGLENKSNFNLYKQHIANGEYSKANTVAEESSGNFGYFAQYINAFTNRIKATQQYLLDNFKDEDKENPHVYSDDEPENVEENTIWV